MYEGGDGITCSTSYAKRFVRINRHEFLARMTVWPGFALQGGQWARRMWNYPFARHTDKRCGHYDSRKLRGQGEGIDSFARRAWR
jgi:hypothetical protein